MPSVRRNQHGGLTYTPAQEKALRRAKAGGMIRNLAHSTARGLRDRNLGEITAKDDGRGELMPNGHRLMTRQFPTVTFRLNGAGVAEAARLMLAGGDAEGAANVQVAPIPVGNK